MSEKKVVNQLGWDITAFIKDLEKNSVEHDLRIQGSEDRERITFELNFRDFDPELNIVTELLEKHFGGGQ